MDEVALEKKLSMSLVQWVASTAIAGVTMSLSIGAYIRASFYGRPEAEKLERRVEIIEVNDRQNIQRMNDKIDEVYRILIDLRSKRE